MAVFDDSAYQSARKGAAILDRAARGKLVVAGSDRRSYLHAMLTNDIEGLASGSGCYAAYLTPQGRMIADMRVLELGDVLLMDLDRERAGEVLQKLDQFVFSEDVKFGDVSTSFGLASIVGPAAPAIVSRLLSPAGTRAPLDAGDLAAWPEFRNARVSFAGQPAIVVASTEIGEPGFDLFVPTEVSGALIEAALDAGAARLGEADAEVLRVEAGRPVFGVDMDSDTIPLEAGIEDRAISFSKGCYPGQEVVIRVLHRGHGRVARKLVGLLIDGTEVPSRGDALRSGDRDAGRVTSAVMSPALGRPVALAMVQRDFVEPGTRLEVAHAGTGLTAATTALPFLGRQAEGAGERRD